MTIKALIELNQDYVNLLKEKLSLGVKYRIQKWINDNEYILNDILEKRKNIILAISKDGMIPNQLEDGSINPDQAEFAEKFNLVLAEEIDQPSRVQLTLEDLAKIETEQNFPAIFSQPGFMVENA
jgi:hypothetical protein